MKKNKIFSDAIYTAGVFTAEFTVHMLILNYGFNFVRNQTSLYICAFVISSLLGTILLLIHLKKNMKNTLLCVGAAFASAACGTAITIFIYSRFIMLYHFGSSFDIIIKLTVSAVSYFILNLLLKKSEKQSLKAFAL